MIRMRELLMLTIVSRPSGKPWSRATMSCVVHLLRWERSNIAQPFQPAAAAVARDFKSNTRPTMAKTIHLTTQLVCGHAKRIYKTKRAGASEPHRSTREEFTHSLKSCVGVFVKSSVVAVAATCQIVAINEVNAKTWVAKLDSSWVASSLNVFWEEKNYFFK